MNLEIIFENENFIAVEKPALVLSVPSRHEDKDDRVVLGRVLEDKLQKQIYPVHRLDFEVGGVILFALSAEAHRSSNQWFSSRDVKKKYQAITQLQNFSHWPENLRAEKGTIQIDSLNEWKCKLLRGKKRSYEHAKGDVAVTHSQLIAIEGTVCHWNLWPLTGRAHQLRFEMSRHGFPILGDELYGSKVKWQQGIALKATEIDFSKCKDAKSWGLPQLLQVKGLF